MKFIYLFIYFSSSETEEKKIVLRLRSSVKCGYPFQQSKMTSNILRFSVPPSGNVLVHEWAKFRWGVFEEYGHLHDAIFPQVYHDNNNTATPTYCTNNQLEGAM